MTGTHSFVSVIYCFYSCSQGQSFTPPSNAWWCYIQQNIVICGDLGGVLLGPGVLRDEVDADAALVHGGAAARVVEGGRVAAAGQTVRAGAELGHAAANQRRVFTIHQSQLTWAGWADRRGTRGRTAGGGGRGCRGAGTGTAGSRGRGRRSRSRPCPRCRAPRGCGRAGGTPRACRGAGPAGAGARTAGRSGCIGYIQLGKNVIVFLIIIKLLTG